LFRNSTQSYKTNYTNLYTTIQHFTKLHKTIHNCIKLYNTSQNFTTLYKTLQHCTNPLQHLTQYYTTLHNFTKPYKTLFKHKLYTSQHNCTQLNKTLHNSATLSKTIQNFKTHYNSAFSTAFTIKKAIHKSNKLYTSPHNLTQLYNKKTLQNFTTTLHNSPKLDNTLQDSPTHYKPLHKSEKYRCLQNLANKTLHNYIILTNVFTTLQNFTTLYKFLQTLQKTLQNFF